MKDKPKRVSIYLKGSEKNKLDDLRVALKGIPLSLWFRTKMIETIEDKKNN